MLCRRTWHQSFRPVRMLALSSIVRLSYIGIGTLGSGQARFKQGPAVSPRHQSIILYPTLYRLPTVRDHPLRGRLHARETGGIFLDQVLPSPSRCNHVRGSHHLYRETLVTPRGNQTHTGESRGVLDGSGGKGWGLLLGDSMAVFYASLVARRSERRREQRHRWRPHHQVRVVHMEMIGMTYILRVEFLNVVVRTVIGQCFFLAIWGAEGVRRHSD